MPKTISHQLIRIRAWTRDEKGLGLVESVVAVGLVGVIVVAFVTTLATGAIAVREMEQAATVQRLAQTQVEIIKGSPYDIAGSSYPAVAEPEGYTISVNVDATLYADTDIQKITVTISRDSEDVFTVEDYKVNR
ncbi:hypothetical protein ACFLXD_03580 [Chloroflexota bacterium]